VVATLELPVTCHLNLFEEPHISEIRRGYNLCDDTQARTFFLATAAFLAACQPQLLFTTQLTNTAGVITPYSTLTSTSTVNLTILPTSTLAPSATPTPRIYTIKSGDNLSQIADSFGLKLSELMAANPTVDPYALQPGMTIVLPPASPSQNGTRVAAGITPVPVTIDQPDCYVTIDGSMWCFALVHNTNSFAVENLIAEIRLVDAHGLVQSNQTAITPLEVLAAGGAMPFVIQFPAPLPVFSKVEVVLQSSMPVVGADTRYIPAKIGSQQVSISADGRTAVISGNILIDGTKPASLVWVAAMAFDAEGNVVGVRRWAGSGAIQPQSPAGFQFNVYSMSGKITKVDVQVEARP